MNIHSMSPVIKVYNKLFKNDRKIKENNKSNMKPTEKQILEIYRNAPNNSIKKVFHVIQFCIVKHIIEYVIEEWEKIRSKNENSSI